MPFGSTRLRRSHHTGARQSFSVKLSASSLSVNATTLPITLTGQLCKRTEQKWQEKVTKGFAMAVKSKALLYAKVSYIILLLDREQGKKSKQRIDIINNRLYSRDPQRKCHQPLTQKEVVLMRDQWVILRTLNCSTSRFATEGGRGQPYSLTAISISKTLWDAFETVNGCKVTLENTGWVCEDPAFDPIHMRIVINALVVLSLPMECHSRKNTIETFKGPVPTTGIVSQGGTNRLFPCANTFRKQPISNRKESVNKHHWVITAMETLANVCGIYGQRFQ